MSGMAPEQDFVYQEITEDSLANISQEQHTLIATELGINPETTSHEKLVSEVLKIHRTLISLEVENADDYQGIEESVNLTQLSNRINRILEL